MRKALATLPLAAALALTGCSTAAAAPHHPARISPLAACRELRAGALANGGTLDLTTVRHVLAQHPGNAGSSHNAYGLDRDLGGLRATLAQPGSGDVKTMTAETLQAALDGDCQRAAQVEIPYGT